MFCGIYRYTRNTPQLWIKPREYLRFLPRCLPMIFPKPDKERLLAGFPLIFLQAHHQRVNDPEFINATLGRSHIEM